MPRKSGLPEQEYPDIEGAKFKVNEIVFSSYRGMYYEAKVLRVREVERDHKFDYWVHYNGWNKKWDQWVEETRLLEFNEANQKEVENKKEQSAAVQTQTKEKKPGKQASSGKKRKSSVSSDEGAPSPQKKQTVSNGLKLKIPNKLKHFLVADWEHVTRDKQLVTLPRDFTVSKIVGEYLATKAGKKDHELLKEITTGLKALFENAVGRVLLYKFERPQYEEQQRKQKEGSPKMCDIYGAEHLLRLFVKLPELLKQSQLQDEEIKLLGDKFNEFLKFLEKNLKLYFQTDYEGTDSEYRQKYTQHEG